MWPMISLPESLVDATSGNPKIQRKDYLPTGSLAVIDQGQDIVAGYTNDMTATYRGSLPVVLFGDHTRAIKYVDQPFALGADGVKVLVPRGGFSAKFLYYYLLSRNIPSRGYSRHFKFLKELSVPVVAPSEQHRIVELLDEADRLRQLRRRADAKAACILPALFLHLFGDPATNPKGWSVGTVGSALVASDYGSSTRASDDGAGLPLIRMGNVGYDGSLQLDDLKYVELPAAEVERLRLQHGDILFNRTNSRELVGKTGLWDADLDAVPASYFIRLRVDRAQVEPVFLWAYMNSAYMKRTLEATARGAIGQANINTTELRALPLYKPPLGLQRSFGGKVLAIRSVLPAATARSDLDELFTLMLQRAFSGQLTAKWRELRMKELLAEMEQQARLLNLPAPTLADA